MSASYDVGAWQIKEDGFGYPSIYGTDEDGNPGDLVAHTFAGHEHLIAAAPDLLDAGQRLLTVFDQQRMTTAERIIVGVSDAGLRTEGNAAIEALRAALSRAKAPEAVR